MKFNAIFAGAAAFALMSSAAMADIVVMDSYARSAGKSAKAGAAFMVIENTGSEGDRLVSAASDISKKVELHTHKDMGDGVMKMMHVEEGFEIPAGGKHMLMRGGDHVMFMGLNGPMEDGETVKVTLTFEKAGDIVVDIPVDLKRKGKHGGMDHSGHGAMKKKDN
ncbi:MAG: copper chaperone PCu(A)C [Pelagimonas sp.]|uniref:copper chaperone PCu(A)C n=1 Tax=Pelagimonas sp. TaxID=2073170 RepID=UPI003D6AD8E7